MIYLIILATISLVTTIALAIYIRKLKKYFEYQIGSEREYRYELERRYIGLYQEYIHHCHKYH